MLRALLLVLTCVVSVPVVTAATVLGAFLLLPLPALLPAPKVTLESQFTRVHTLSGEEIAVFKDVEQKIPVNPADVPEVLKKAVVAAEDRNFYHHSGVDLRGSMRALYADLSGGRVTQGGSTITQQYVKNAYTDKRRTLVRKMHEAILAKQLEREDTKDAILFKYLSTIYLGDQAYGVGAASETYFRKRVNDLTLSEAAMLAGLVPAPTDYAPRENLAVAEDRRQVVLGQMLSQHLISQDEHDAAVAQHLFLASRGTPPPGATVVWPVQEVPKKYPDFVDYVYRYLVHRYGPNTVLRGGLDVTVTLDPRLQDLALSTVADSLKGTKDDLQMSIVSVEPRTGYVKAMVGGRDFGHGTYASDNFALGGCEPKPTDPATRIEVAATCWDGTTVAGGGSGRQPGSAFKPFTLAAAFAKGYTPNKVYSAPDHLSGPGYDIRNAADGEGGGSMDLRHATWNSVNTVFAQLIRDVGVRDTAAMAKKLGITSAWESPRIHGLSYTLGTLGVSPLDMASAYSVFAGRGMRAEPTPVLVVRGANGQILEDNTKDRGTRVLDEVVADNVTDVLRGVITHGTAYPRADIDRPAAGKTGTTDNYINAWFVGFTPTLSTSVWMGYAKDQKTPLVDINGTRRVFGGTIPAQTWHNFMLPAVKDVPVTDFNQPPPHS